MNRTCTCNPGLAPCLAVLGTGSDVGKSIVTTALCRIFSRRGVRVAPFKAQNMSNNSGVTPEGLEMGRAQIVQAEAARIPPHVDMNPVLLKPTSDVGCQVVLLGTARGNQSARDYHDRRELLFDEAAAALERLRRSYELVILEGAGSCAEVNLMAGDIVNLRMAERAGAAVVLVADIHRGGVFGQIVGTLECLELRHRGMVRGVIVNRFRGDKTLFADGVRWIEQRTGKTVLGVLPWFDHFRIESEDSVVIENPPTVLPPGADDRTSVAVVRLPHISNFTDFEPLSAVEGLQVHFLEKPQSLQGFRAAILPGSKNTRHDLDWLQASGWALSLLDFHRRDGRLLGICGGYQMLGRWVHDPEGHEGAPGSSAGLGLLPVETVLRAPKTTTRTRFSWGEVRGAGYEIHMGQTVRHGGMPWFKVLERNGRPEEAEDGCIALDGRV
ncbi:MAG: cobyric acid synthase, partial [Desulfobacterales bacterium]|nr:cobyric acid synthase [Desulfobacterales bacterium]